MKKIKQKINDFLDDSKNDKYLDFFYYCSLGVASMTFIYIVMNYKKIF